MVSSIGRRPWACRFAQSWVKSVTVFRSPSTAQTRWLPVDLAHAVTGQLGPNDRELVSVPCTDGGQQAARQCDRRAVIIEAAGEIVETFLVPVYAIADSLADVVAFRQGHRSAERCN